MPLAEFIQLKLSYMEQLVHVRSRNRQQSTRVFMETPILMITLSRVVCIVARVSLYSLDAQTFSEAV